MLLLTAAGLAALLSAQVTVTPQNNRITVDIDGKPFTALIYGPDAAKPYLYPLRAASGTIVTRRFPMEDAPGDSRDHPHHKGLTFAHASLNGLDFWANEPSNPGRKGRIVLQRVLATRSGRRQGSIQALLAWQDAAGATILEDTRTFTFHSHPTLRILDADILVKAVETATFGDTHEGSFGVRVAAWLEEPAPQYVPTAKGEARPTEPRRTGRITNAAGALTEAEVRGKRALWADYSGESQGERLGIAIFDHPSNPRHPTYWHTRGYGIFAANIFGVRAFENDKSKDGSLTLAPGQTLRLRYRVVIHPGDAASADLPRLYREYTR